jgi:hypothetical protein
VAIHVFFPSRSLQAPGRGEGNLLPWLCGYATEQ